MASAMPKRRCHSDQGKMIRFANHLAKWKNLLFLCVSPFRKWRTMGSPRRFRVILLVPFPRSKVPFGYLVRGRIQPHNARNRRFL